MLPEVRKMKSATQGTWSEAERLTVDLDVVRTDAGEFLASYTKGHRHQGRGETKAKATAEALRTLAARVESGEVELRK